MMGFGDEGKKFSQKGFSIFPDHKTTFIGNIAKNIKPNNSYFSTFLFFFKIYFHNGLEHLQDCAKVRNSGRVILFKEGKHNGYYKNQQRSRETW